MVLNCLHARPRGQMQTSSQVCWGGVMMGRQLWVLPGDCSGLQVPELCHQQPGDNACALLVKRSSNPSVGRNAIIWKCWVCLWHLPPPGPGFPITDPQAHRVDQGDPCNTLEPLPPHPVHSQPGFATRIMFFTDPMWEWFRGWGVGDTGVNAEFSVGPICSSILCLWILSSHTTGTPQTRPCLILS